MSPSRVWFVWNNTKFSFIFGAHIYLKVGLGLYIHSNHPMYAINSGYNRFGPRIMSNHRFFLLKKVFLNNKNIWLAFRVRKTVLWWTWVVWLCHIKHFEALSCQILVNSWHLNISRLLELTQVIRSHSECRPWTENISVCLIFRWSAWEQCFCSTWSI